MHDNKLGKHQPEHFRLTAHYCLIVIINVNNVIDLLTKIDYNALNRENKCAFSTKNILQKN